MDPESVARESMGSHDIDRVLVVERVPSENLERTRAGGSVDVVQLGGIVSQFKSDWRMVSHTFAMQDDGSALLTYLFEKEKL